MPISLTPLFDPRDISPVPTSMLRTETKLRPHLVCAAALLLSAGTLRAFAQVAATGLERSEAVPSATLPDAPSSISSSAETASDASATIGLPSLEDPQAPKANGMPRSYPKDSPTAITVLPGHSAPPQTVRDKLVGSVIDSVSPFTFAGEIISGGYSHVTNGSPNFGTDAPAFGQRVGAAIARGTSQNLFSEGVLAAVLHEDPRYYQMGSSHPFFKRVLYAGTRPIITRTDSGHLTPNLSLLGGYLGAAALTKTYYPDLNQGFNQTLQTYGGSLGGAALGFVVNEFLSDTLQILHLKKTN